VIFAATIATAIALSQEYPFRSEGPLQITNVEFPQTTQMFSPVEITFDLSGTWNNPFDPNQIDVTATVVGSQDLVSIVHGFVVRDTEIDFAANRMGAPKSVKWKIRFTPWNIGGYGVFIRIADMKSTIEHPKIGIRVNNGEGGFFQVERNARYFAKSRRSAVLSGATVSLESPDWIQSLDALQQSGARLCRIIWPEPSAQRDWRNISEIAIDPDPTSFHTVQMMEAALDAAKARNLAVILTLSSAVELSPSGGWARSRFNKANGGPCDSPEEFWTNLRARLLYKRGLRYLFSRLQNYDHVLGVEFFHGIEAPSFWIQEMANEVVGVHTYLLPISSFPSAPDVWRLNRVGYASVPMVYRDTPANTALQIVSDLRSARTATNKPIVPIAVAKAASAEHARMAVWAAIFGGAAAGTILASANELAFDYEPFNRFVSKIDWQRRKFVEIVPVVLDGIYACALADESGAIALAVPEGQAAMVGNVQLPVQRDGNYTYSWYDISTGEELGSGESRASGNKLSIPLSRSSHGIAGVITRK
jgi:hypothetical protein